MSATAQMDLLIYLVPIVVIWGLYLGLGAKRERKSLAARDASIRAGLSEPATLHPAINPNLCLGCGSCVTACPEGNVLGLIRGKAELINPALCIGHGACKTACPLNAIALVFGTEKRGIDIPVVSPDFETNVPGIFIAGELGGMGLIRNAIEQGRQAMDSIRRLNGNDGRWPLDVLIVGAGPAGFSASLAAMQNRLRFVTVEQDTLGGTVAHYPRGKVVMTAPANLPLVGKVRFSETSKEALLDFWRTAEKNTGLQINYRERMETVTRMADGFEVKTNRRSYQTRALLLAIGRRGTPRKLGVPGEDLPKVVYRLVDPEQYRGQCVLVVGGGDSAMEAACDIAMERDTVVTLSYRGDAFSRAKEKNRQRVKSAEAAGRLRVMVKSNVKAITRDRVAIEHDGRRVETRNDAVIVCAGGILPTPFLKENGIAVETKYGTR